MRGQRRAATENHDGRDADERPAVAGGHRCARNAARDDEFGFGIDEGLQTAIHTNTFNPPKVTEQSLLGPLQSYGPRSGPKVEHDRCASRPRIKVFFCVSTPKWHMFFLSDAPCLIYCVRFDLCIFFGVWHQLGSKLPATCVGETSRRSGDVVKQRMLRGRCLAESSLRLE